MRNSVSRYGLVSILLHWVMAILILTLLVLGLVMAHIPMRRALYTWHIELGVLALLLMTIRLPWRLYNMSPSATLIPRWEQMMTKGMIFFCYILMFALPITGWLLASSSAFNVSFFNLLDLPELVNPDNDSRTLFIMLHQWLSYFLIAVMTAHLIVTLTHHFIKKDNLMRSIIKP